MAKYQEAALLRINFRPILGSRVHVVVPDATMSEPGKLSLATRLRKTTFRGIDECVAGNCCRWNNANLFLSDLFIEAELRRSFVESIRIMKSDTRREMLTGMLGIHCRGTTGWELTDHASNYPSDALEEFDVGGGKKGLRVKRSRYDLVAPKTKLMSVRYDLCRQDERWLVIMRAIRPGYDYGSIRALTANSGRVLFDYSHPGA